MKRDNDIRGTELVEMVTENLPKRQYFGRSLDAKTEPSIQGSREQHFQQRVLQV